MAYLLNRTLILCRAAFHKSVIYRPVTKITLVKTYHHLSNRTHFKAEKHFKYIDNISDDYKLIYREEQKHNFALSCMYHFGWIGAIICLVSMGYVIWRDPPEEEEVLVGVFHEPYKLVGDVGKVIGGCCGIILCTIIIRVSRMIPLRIYHNPKEKMYKAVFTSIIGKRKVVTFGEGTAVQKYKNQYFNYFFDINGHTILLDETDFPVPFVREQMIRKSK